MSGSRRLTVWQILLGAPWVAAVIAARSTISDNSFLWHVRAGTLQLKLGSVLTSDPFSAALEGSPWRTQSWLADLAYGYLERAFELGFVPWITAGAMMSALVATMLVAHRIGRSAAATATIGVLAGALSVVFHNPRPVVFSYALFALVVLADQDKRIRWTLPALMWMWVALHGSFVLGVVYLLLQAFRRKDRYFVREVPAYAAVSLSTAHGWGVVDYLVAFAKSGPALDRITEWATPDLLSISLSPFLGLLVALLIAGVTRGRLNGRDLVVVVPFLVFGLSSARAVFPAFIALAPFAARALDGWRPAFGRAPLPGSVAALGAVLALPFLLPATLGLDSERFPIRMAEAVNGDRILHDDVVGGYLIYARWPDVRVMLDDRAELYREYLVQFSDARAGRPGWEEFVAESKANVAILGERDPIRQLLVLSGWTEVDTEGKFVLLEAPAG